MCLEKGCNPWIEVDGGVTPENAYKVSRGCEQQSGGCEKQQAGHIAHSPPCGNVARAAPVQGVSRTAIPAHTLTPAARRACNVLQVIEAGANAIVSGSGVFGAKVGCCWERRKSWGAPAADVPVLLHGPLTAVDWTGVCAALLSVPPTPTMLVLRPQLPAFCLRLPRLFRTTRRPSRASRRASAPPLCTHKRPDVAARRAVNTTCAVAHGMAWPDSHVMGRWRGAGAPPLAAPAPRRPCWICLI